MIEPDRFIRYRDDLEKPDPDEAETARRIMDAMRREGEITRERYGRAIRTSHAKAHGLIRGELQVLDGLPEALRQGLFAQPRTYPVIARLSHVPGELLDDRRVSNPRGFSFKVLGVEGEMLPSHHGQTSQDFLLDTGPAFPSPGPKAFLATIMALQKATPAPEGVKQAVSAASRAANAALNAVGADSANLDFFGHPPLHPLAETYFTQTPYRHGDYVMKLRVAPASETLKAWIGKKIDTGRDENALRLAVQAFLTQNPAAFEIAVQLLTNPDTMPIENANTVWPEEESPYRAVARMTFPAQDPYGPNASRMDEALSFSPSHSLAAHRPLGGINRARLMAYETMADARRRTNGAPILEPEPQPS